MGSPVFIGSPNFMDGRKHYKPEAVVIHIAQGSRQAVDSWFNNPASQVSAHYLVCTDGAIHQYVHERDTAWHAGRVHNATWVGVKRGPTGVPINPNYYCCTPDTRILTRDLQWVPAGDLKAGDPIVGFEENSAPHMRRRLVDAWVTSNQPKKAPIYRVVLCDGTEIRATGEHRWLTRSRGTGTGQRWMRTDAMADSLESYKRTGPLLIPRFFQMHRPLRTYDAGFLSAAFDAEGSIQHNAESQTFGLTFAQKDNALASTVYRMLADHGFGLRNTQARADGVVDTVLRGGRQEAFRFLMQHRPPRLLERFTTRYRLSDLRLTPHSDVQVKAVVPDGETEIAAISSSSATYIAEGFGAHNTVGVEHEGKSGVPFTDAMLLRSAELLHDIAVRWSIPLDRQHVVGHHEIYALKPFCPGDGVDLDKLILLAKGTT